MQRNTGHHSRGHTVHFQSQISSEQNVQPAEPLDELNKPQKQQQQSPAYQRMDSCGAYSHVSYKPQLQQQQQVWTPKAAEYRPKTTTYNTRKHHTQACRRSQEADQRQNEISCPDKNYSQVEGLPSHPVPSRSGMQKTRNVQGLRINRPYTGNLGYSVSTNNTGARTMGFQANDHKKRRQLLLPSYNEIKKSHKQKIRMSQLSVLNSIQEKLKRIKGFDIQKEHKLIVEQIKNNNLLDIISPSAHQSDYTSQVTRNSGVCSTDNIILENNLATKQGQETLNQQLQFDVPTSFEFYINNKKKALGYAANRMSHDHTAPEGAGAAASSHTKTLEQGASSGPSAFKTKKQFVKKTNSNFSENTGKTHSNGLHSGLKTSISHKDSSKNKKPANYKKSRYDSWFMPIKYWSKFKTPAKNNKELYQVKEDPKYIYKNLFNTNPNVPLEDKMNAEDQLLNCHKQNYQKNRGELLKNIDVLKKFETQLDRQGNKVWILKYRVFGKSVDNSTFT